MKKTPKPDLDIDPRDPNGRLWRWLLARSQQRASEREKHSKIAKQRTDEYWENHSAAVLEDHRQVREAWLTDQELLTMDMRLP